MPRGLGARQKPRDGKDGLKGPKILPDIHKIVLIIWTRWNIDVQSSNHMEKTALWHARSK